MSEEQYTRCPGCRTIFRVTSQQLALKGGQVRCGHCRTVFDGTAALVSLAPQPGAQDFDQEQGPPTVTLRPARALRPADEPAPQQPSVGAAEAPDEPPADADWENRFAWDKPRQRMRSTWAGAGAVVLALALVGQAIWHFRDAIAAHFPASRSALVGLCAQAGCTIRPLRDVAALSIEASDLQADAAHKGLLILTATVRNRANFAIAFPHLELTLTDAQDQPVVRRAFAPADYAGGTADLGRGLPANGEVAIKLFIDASATSQAGYRLYLFYP
ncbi:MAG: zinc-ribbon domain-containing protein [Betaproteobacteria bacterium]|nr:zinc-ribbon domain-containing protein [Betaproteobacteria bacterium]